MKKIRLRPGRKPSNVQLLQMLRYMAGFYEARTTKRLAGEKLSCLRRHRLLIGEHLLATAAISAGHFSCCAAAAEQGGPGSMWTQVAAQAIAFHIMRLGDGKCTGTTRCQSLEGTSTTICCSTILARNCT